ncbi:MAG: AprI/Inh family metalloprotease inhibitor [Caulobacterales bacterium]|nr:AprI/Inh family metalloprotease inhibitor [Caulobacterales bacterium]
MKTWILGAGLAMATAGAAVAEDREAGVPLSPAEAAGAWTLESAGHPICTIRLGADRSARAASDCAGALPGAPAGWRPTADGMALIGANGQALLGFNRWSNSLFVSHRASGVDVQLRRGGPMS